MGVFSPRSSGPIWLANVQCVGTEASLADCPHDDWGINGCSHVEDVSITCEPNPLAGAHISMRITFV